VKVGYGHDTTSGGRYLHHHAISDTFDKVDPRLLAINTAVMAAAAWLFADAPTSAGRRLTEEQAVQSNPTSR
jgi:hypothetical protein